MQISKITSAGAYAKCDARVTLCPADVLEVEIRSAVQALFGDSIKRCVSDMLQAWQIECGHVLVEDKGALEWVIAARLEAAIRLQEE